MTRRVLVTGTFDKLHEGHRDFLRDASRYGNELYILLVSDEIVLKNKGRLPEQNEQERLSILKGLEFVTDVTIDYQHESIDTAVSLKPDVVVLGFDQTTKHSKNLIEYCKQYGIQFYILSEQAGGIHTSNNKQQKYQ